MGISRKESLECFQSDDLIGIGMVAEFLPVVVVEVLQQFFL